MGPSDVPLCLVGRGLKDQLYRPNLGVTWSLAPLAFMMMRCCGNACTTLQCLRQAQMIEQVNMLDKLDFGNLC